MNVGTETTPDLTASAASDRRDAAIDRLLMRQAGREVGNVVTGLRLSGVEPIVLKGIATQHRLYAGETRRSSDIDLLVGPRQGRAASRALRRLGYARAERGGHASTWVAAGRTPVDLHRTLPRCEVGAATVWAVLERHRRSLTVEGRQVTVLDDPALAVHLAIHLSQTSGDRQREDLDRAVAQLPAGDWSEATAIAGELGCTTTLAWALDQAKGGSALRRTLGLPPVARRDLPARKPTDSGLRRFMSSPVHWRERFGALVAWVRTLASQRSLARWAAGRDRPVPTSRLGCARTAWSRAAAFVLAQGSR